MAQLTQWREEGNKLVCLDANKNIYHKSLGKALTNVDGLNMREVVGTFMGKKIANWRNIFLRSDPYRWSLGDI